MKGLLQSLVKQVGDAWLQYRFCARSQHLTRVQPDTPYIACYHLLTQDLQVQMLLVNLSNTCDGFDRVHSDSDISTGCGAEQWEHPIRHPHDCHVTPGLRA